MELTQTKNVRKQYVSMTYMATRSLCYCSADSVVRSALRWRCMVVNAG